MNIKQIMKIRDELQRVQDMAIKRKAYTLLCLQSFPQFFKNLAKICSFNDRNLQKHWGSEAITKLQDVLTVKVKVDKGNAEQVKREAFIEYFINGYLGDNYEEYNYEDKRNWFEGAIADEGYNPKDFDIRVIIDTNRDRMISLFEKLKTVPFQSTRDDLIDIMNEFIES